MLFNSFHYVLFLLAVLAFCEAVRRRDLQQIGLLVASYYFYWAFSSTYVLLLVLSTLVDFYCGQAIFTAPTPRRRKAFLALSLVAQLGLLAYFKYVNFAIQSAQTALGWLGVERDLPLLHVTLPVAISFYTFMSLSYTLDIYFGRFRPVDSLRTFALYVAFFPHLVAGPILRAADFLPQLRSPVALTWDNLRIGSTFILCGLIKKLVVADNLSEFVGSVFQGPLTHDTLTVIVGAVAFAVQIYCDFSGYTDIAIGSARLLGLRFPGNFAYPYFSPSIAEFWRRWHISLSSWLRDYLYIPLGGNRRGKARQAINLIVTMGLGGLWHGASWNFVIWGLYHGVLLMVHRLVFTGGTAFHGRVWLPLKVACTFWLVCIGWVMFVVPEVDRMAFYVGKMVLWQPTMPRPLLFASTHGFVLLVLGAFFCVHLVSWRLGGLAAVLATLRGPRWTAWVTAGTLALFFAAATQQRSFIYFKF